jgi:hypothetical protein
VPPAMTAWPIACLHHWPCAIWIVGHLLHNRSGLLWRSASEANCTGGVVVSLTCRAEPVSWALPALAVALTATLATALGRHRLVLSWERFSQPNTCLLERSGRPARSTRSGGGPTAPLLTRHDSTNGSAQARAQASAHVAQRRYASTAAATAAKSTTRSHACRLTA